MQDHPFSFRVIGNLPAYCRVLVFSLLFCMFASVHAPPACGQAFVMVNPTGAIPKQYKTWSLFLVCNPEWLSSDKSKDLYALYQQFQNFGRTIGDDHLAVWFWKDKKYANDPNLAANVDVKRSARFCKALQLKPSESPHIVIMASYPDESNLPQEFATFRLAKMTLPDVSGLLGKLSDQLLLQGKVDPAAISEVQGRLWIRLLSAAQQVIGNFGCAWSFKINTGVLSAELHSCQKQ